MEKPGSQVLITQDVRKPPHATGMKGIYEGDFPYAVHLITPQGHAMYDIETFLVGNVTVSRAGVTRPAVAVIPQLVFVRDQPLTNLSIAAGEPRSPTQSYWFVEDNSRIKLEDGSIIWGWECWWRELEPDEIIDMELETKNLEEHISFLRNIYKAMIEMEKKPDESTS